MASNQALLLPAHRRTNIHPDLWLDPSVKVSGTSVVLADSNGNAPLSVTPTLTWANAFEADVPTALAGKLTKSLKLNGSSQTAWAPAYTSDLSNMAELSLSIWYKATNVTALQYLLGIENAYILRLRATTGYIGAQIATDNDAWAERIVTDSEAVTPGAWEHLLLTYATGNLRMYFKGSLVANKVVTSVDGDVISSITKFFIGSANGNNYWFGGLLCDARVYDKCLLAADASLLWGGDEPPTAPIHRWRMDDAMPATCAIGDTIVEWETRDGNNTVAAQATAGSRPCVIPQDNTTSKLVVFDGTDDVVSDSEMVVTGKTGRVAVPVKTVWSGTERVIYSQSLAAAADTYLKLGISATGKMWYKFNIEGTADELTGSTILGTDWHTLEWVSDGTTISMLVDGVAETITETGGANNGKWFGHLTEGYRSVVGAVTTSGGTAGFMKGSIGQLVAARRDLTTAEQAVMRARLAQSRPTAPVLPTPSSYNLDDPCDDDTGWTASAGTLTESTDYVRRGTKSLKLTGDTTAVAAYKPAAISAINTKTSQYNLRARFYVTDKGDGTPSVKDVKFYLMQSESINMSVILDPSTNVPDVGWNVLDTPIPDYTARGASWDLTGSFTGSVVGIGFSGTTQNATGAVYLDEVLIYRNSSPLPKIVFTFDDFAAPAVTTMAAILESHGWKGAFAAIGSTMTDAQWLAARALEAAGHTVVGHGYAHTSWDTPITAAAAEADLRSMQKVMHANGCTRGSRIFVFPYGAQGLTAGHRDVVELYTDCVVTTGGLKDLERSTWAGSDQRGGLWNPNPPRHRRILTRGYLGDKSLTTAKIDLLIAANGFEVIMQHTLDNGTNYLTEAQFTAVCDYIAAKEAAGLLEVSSLYEEVYG